MRISDVVRYTTDFTPTPIWTPDGNTIALWDFNTQGSILTDLSGNGFHGTINGATSINICPEEDFDQDGIAAWEDCDDSNPNLLYQGDGLSPDCAASSCKSIIDDGLSIGDGYYWVDPTGSNPMEVYCDMTDDDGGWALVGVTCVNRGQSGWNDDGDLAPSSFGQFNDHWHYSATTINASPR